MTGVDISTAAWQDGDTPRPSGSDPNPSPWLETFLYPDGRPLLTVTKVVVYKQDARERWDWDAYCGDEILLIPFRALESEADAVAQVQALFGLEVPIESREPIV